MTFELALGHVVLEHVEERLEGPQPLTLPARALSYA